MVDSVLTSVDPTLPLKSEVEVFDPIPSLVNPTLSLESEEKIVCATLPLESEVKVVESMSSPPVTADFTTHGGSHLYGLPCPFADSLNPVDHFCTFDVSKIIPKNMQ